jgi:hypothetical protein
MNWTVPETTGQGRENQVEGYLSTNMPTTKQDAAASDFEVDPRVKIGLDLLTAEERRIVQDTTSSKARFLEVASDPKKVERLRPNAPYLSLKITPKHRLIYTQEGDRIVVEDLTSQAMIDWFASMRSGRTKSAPKNRKPIGSKKTK